VTKRFALLTSIALHGAAMAQDAATVERRATPAALFPADQVAALSKTLPAEREVRFRMRAPADLHGCGVLVYVSPTESGELPAAWIPELEREHLVWIAADGFGNAHPTAQRTLVAVMALKLALQACGAETQRRYIAGMSGGGRVASQVIAHFPQLFSGALFIVGADYFKPGDAPSVALLSQRRLVFLTGPRDFNQREMKSVAARYRKAGNPVLLLDEPGFGHELATAAQLARAIEFLDAR
jgi:predicted esterase